jgi:hypothetical protein
MGNEVMIENCEEEKEPYFILCVLCHPPKRGLIALRPRSLQRHRTNLKATARCSDPKGR